MTATGHAGKVRLERRLLTARHGATLLDRKQRIIAEELDRLELHADSTRRRWEEQANEAAVWLQRTVALDGQELLKHASPADPTIVEVKWGGAMGVRYPVDATCVLPDATPAGGSSALAWATATHRSAIVVAAQYAAAQRAVVLLSRELTATRTRQGAIENRWIPRLENELRVIRQKLEEQELEENLRVHWAAKHQAETSSATRTRDIGETDSP
ncbi:V-type ATP synthase subunit D [Cryobacterium psychrophilum]|uniref:V-type ATP synthase subunit D n=1 Tax=Cryobacterium psychrophilum TaxID=41988 RepID=UPI0010EC67C1|nr:V-type ATP synthase subunit D [Cryobacterium psychrophilum]TDW30141.1 vacuolar-type H+-ATPase subunit D/Vma8 [Cryobacterium psychrophilum]